MISHYDFARKIHIIGPPIWLVFESLIKDLWYLEVLKELIEKESEKVKERERLYEDLRKVIMIKIFLIKKISKSDKLERKYSKKILC